MEGYSKLQYDVWVEKQRLENPLANHRIISRCLLPLLASYFTNNYSIRAEKAEDKTYTVKSSRRTNYKRRKHRRVSAKSYTQDLGQLILNKFSALENHLNKRLDLIEERLNYLEEKHDKGVGELLECVQKEIYKVSTMKGYFTQNNAGGTFTERSMPIRPDLEKATGIVDSISERSEEESEADPLEELLKKTREKKVFGINLRENHKNVESKEDPIMALLMQDTESSSEVVNKTVPAEEKPKPRNMMFHVNKGKSENNPPSMDDLLFGD